MNVPNILSAIRILLVPVFVAVVMSGRPNALVYGMIIFLAAGMTDALDGMIARKYGCETVLGKILDPLADKLMVAAALVCGWLCGVLPLFLPAVYAAKELLQCVLGAVLYKKMKDMIPSNVLGKITTALFYATVFLSYMIPDMPPLLKNALCFLCAALLAVTALVYVPAGIKAYKASKENGHEV